MLRELYLKFESNAKIIHQLPKNKIRIYDYVYSCKHSPERKAQNFSDNVVH